MVNELASAWNCRRNVVFIRVKSTDRCFFLHFYQNPNVENYLPKVAESVIVVAHIIVVCSNFRIGFQKLYLV